MSSTGQLDFPIPAMDLPPGDSPDLVDIRLRRRGPAAPVRARYRRAEDSRAAILQAVVDLVERDGGEPVHVDRIAERAGLHKMAIYRIFGSRAALLDEVAGRLCDGERARWDEIAGATDGTPRAVLMFDDLALRGALRAFLHTHCLASGAAEPGRMTDALMLVWQGAVSPRWTDEEVAALCDGLPAVVDGVIRGHVPAAAGAASPIETCE
ncbi:TetR/AcrR family transcriptional regulator [Burkholderia gladioli]|uniref:TetR/AcrR family transcriptional regulator n=1 Tax=Burkholderia gladioli TaxID=28095 RepID=UPI0034DB18E5